MRGNQRSQFHKLKNTSDTILLSDTMVLYIALVYVDIVNQVCLLERMVTNNYLKNQKKFKKKLFPALRDYNLLAGSSSSAAEKNLLLATRSTERGA